MSGLGQERRHFASCGSTNDEAMRLGRAGAPHGLVVTAGTQTQGRGRLGRAWYSPSGESLYLSVLLRPPLPPQRAPLLTLCAGVAVADAVAATLGDRARVELKWPNDVLVAGRKAAGILTEMSCTGSRLDWVVVGIGVNLNNSCFPGDLVDRATSLRLCGGQVADLVAFTERLLADLGTCYDTYVTAGPAPVLRRFTERAAYLCRGAVIAVRSGTEQLSGIPVGLAEDGALLLRDQAGAVHRVIAGEIDDQVLC